MSNDNSHLIEALQRIAEMTPNRANAFNAHDLHLTVKVIAETAIDREMGNLPGDPDRNAVINQLAGEAAIAALLLHVACEAMPTDRGGSNGPKGTAWQMYLAARRFALTLHSNAAEVRAGIDDLVEASQRATGNLANLGWKPSRAHYESLRNAIKRFIETTGRSVSCDQ